MKLLRMTDDRFKEIYSTLFLEIGSFNILFKLCTLKVCMQGEIIAAGLLNKAHQCG